VTPVEVGGQIEDGPEMVTLLLGFPLVDCGAPVYSVAITAVLAEVQPFKVAST
jgi:hypothetical protein